MKFTLSWLKDHLDTTASLDEIVETLTRIGLEVEGRRGQGEDLRALHGRLCDLGRAASQCRSPARLHGRYRRAATPIQVVCGAPECPHRHEERVRAARHLHSGQEHHARHRHHPRRREPRACCARRRSSRSPTITTASSICPDDAPVGAALRGLCRPRRSGDRDQPHAEPSRLHLDPRHRPRSRGRRPRHARRATTCPRLQANGACPVSVTLDFEPATRSSAPPSRCVSCAA